MGAIKWIQKQKNSKYTISNTIICVYYFSIHLVFQEIGSCNPVVEWKSQFTRLLSALFTAHYFNLFERVDT